MQVRHGGTQQRLWMFTVFSTYILNYLKDHVARQKNVRLLSCPMLAGTAWLKGEVDGRKRRVPLLENCWADLAGRSFQSLDVASRVGEGGRADSKAVAWILTVRKRHHGWFLQGTDPWTGLKDGGRKRFGSQRSHKMLLLGLFSK